MKKEELKKAPEPEPKVEAPVPKVNLEKAKNGEASGWNKGEK